MCKTICLTVRDKNLTSFTRQRKLENPTCLAKMILEESLKLFVENTNEPFSVRSIGISAAELIGENTPVQFDMFGETEKNEREEKLEHTIDNLKNRYGSGCIKTASLLTDEKLTDFEPYDDIQRENCFGVIKDV